MMTDRNAPLDPNEPPEDVAMLYSWANLHGAKYRDFSFSRAQIRERARQRAQQAIDEEREQARLAAEARAQEGRRAAQAALAEERARMAAEMAAQQAAAQQAVQQAAQQAAQLAARQAAQEAAQQAAQEIARRAAEREARGTRAAQSAQQATWQQPVPEQRTTPVPYTPPQPLPYTGPPPAQAPRPTLSPQPAASTPPVQHPAPPALRSAAATARPATPEQAAMREAMATAPARSPWSAPENRELPLRPAWLAERPQTQAAAPVPQSPHDTLQGSRERLTSRWFALKGLFEGTPEPVADAPPAPAAARPPALAIFSLAGGVGKTSIVATLGRALSSRGERVLLVDTAAFGLLPFFFGARDQRPGQLRTFSPPAASGDAPIQMITIDPEGLAPENGHEPLTAEIQKHCAGLSRVIVDLATASGATTRRILRLSPLVLVPVVPDMNSVVSVSSIDAFIEHNSGVTGKASLPYYILNQFDASLPLHLDVREVLRERLGDRLLPFALRRAPAVSEALAEGMTVMDYAPNSTVAEDFGSLAGWVKSQSAPAISTFRGVRWSER